MHANGALTLIMGKVVLLRLATQSSNSLLRPAPGLLLVGWSNLSIITSILVLSLVLVLGNGGPLLARLLQKATKKLNHVLWRSGSVSSGGLLPRTMVHLWKTEVIPLLEYAAEIWDGAQSAKWVAKFESLQYTFARRILRLSLHSTPAAVALRAELGLPTLASRRSAAKLRFWFKLCSAPSHRLLHTVFRRRHGEALRGGARLSSLWAMRSTLHDHALESTWVDGVSCSHADWAASSLAAISSRREHVVSAEVVGKSSLALYGKLGTLHSAGCCRYLEDTTNAAGVVAKTRLRLGQELLMDRLASLLKWPERGKLCPLCRSGCNEDVMHYLLECAALSPCRDRFLQELRVKLPTAGTPGLFVLKTLLSGGENALLLILGRRVAFPAHLVGDREHCGLAEWLLDKTSKNFVQCSAGYVKRSWGLYAFVVVG